MTQGSLFVDGEDALAAAERRLVVAVEQQVPGSTLLRRFLAFHRENPHVYRLLEQFALDAARAGRRHFGAKAIFERVRWELSVETRSDDGLKLNNSAAAYYSRLFRLHHPEHADLFEVRALGGGHASEEDHA